MRWPAKAYVDMNNKRWLALWAVVMAPVLLAAPAVDVLNLPAVKSVQALHGVMQAVTRAGDRLVAVGERGIVLLSDDNGFSWRQGSVPVSTTLTAVQFVDPRNGWAVGHGGVVLGSHDGGEHWEALLNGLQAADLELAAAQQAGDEHRLQAARQNVADGADKPLLALSFSDARTGWVVGAYGMALHTDDGGATWASWAGRLPNPQGAHLYAVAQHGAEVYLAGEQGLFLRSGDAGGSFEKMATPYAGSYFSLVAQADGAVLVGGLRGTLLRSTDGGHSFATVSNPVPVSVNDLRQVGDQLLLVNQAGAVLQASRDRTRLIPLDVPPGQPLTAVTQAADGALVGVGFAGPVRLATSMNAAE